MFVNKVIELVKKHVPNRDTFYSISIEARAGHEFNIVNIETKDNGQETYYLDPRKSDIDILDLLGDAGYDIGYIRYTHIVVSQSGRPTVTLQYTVME